MPMLQHQDCSRPGVRIFASAKMPALLRVLRVPVLTLATLIGQGPGLAAAPLFENSVVSNDIDFILSSDPAVPACLQYIGQVTQEMPGALDTSDLMAPDVFTFEVAFLDGSKVGIWVHPSVGSRESAEDLASLLLGPLGRLPAVMRQKLSHVVIQSGNHAAFGEHLGRFFVVYAENMHARLSTHDLDETVFHEAVHATLDAEWSQSAEWQSAQTADGAFITEYAAEKPQGEDLAETALFALTYIRHEERLPMEVARGVETMIPARLAVIKVIFEAPEPDLSGPAPAGDCLAP